MLADAYLCLAPPNFAAAEAESGAVESECRRLMKKRLDPDEAPGWLDDIPALRVRALRLVARVEDGLGRAARAERARQLAESLGKQ
ncbi:hypothetical protein CspeluHIS016_0103370 [Cutaneotrichosporon spelunceum]|uniref:Uncharacterized protein n=1 Tax=Cutaneotrichosporon spelunceum TaxID=1672016 RepID=A0AAD3Y7U8_9TREE|nr:hypothetical protein CspeluHIS016_0103370 [Cutaneotrichosporon spelunceum]